MYSLRVDTPILDVVLSKWRDKLEGALREKRSEQMCLRSEVKYNFQRLGNGDALIKRIFRLEDLKDVLPGFR